MAAHLFHIAVITIAVTSNTNVFLTPSKPVAVLNHSAVHYNCSNKEHKRISAAVQNGSTTIAAATINRNVFLPPSRPAANLHQSAVQYNCINKQHKRIPGAFQTGSRSTSQRSALQLQ